MNNLLMPFFQTPISSISALACIRILGYKQLLREHEMQINVLHFQLIHSTFEETKLIIESCYGTEYLQACGYSFNSSLKKVQVGGLVFLYLPTRQDDLGQHFAPLLLTHFLRCYQLLLLLKGYYIRGVIDIGNIAREPDSFITSQLEFLLAQEKKAKYPRIILSPKTFSQITTTQVWQPRSNPSFLVQTDESESEKVFFINPLYYQDFWKQGQLKLQQNVNSLYIQPSESSPPFVEWWNTGIQVTQKLLEIAQEFRQSYLEANQKHINTYLKTLVGNQLLKYSFSPAIRQKYEWLFNFILWTEQAEITSPSSPFAYYGPTN
ncbi:MAG: hypothetical protein RML72_07190 [Bacteroidia bacterium]|nr:hypothetical protein [Bacteroidia bacterium]MDW8158645.1 hypothetical protein [Bacteroidia bacterium]